MKKKSIIFCISFVFGLSLFAQQTEVYKMSDELYQKAINLFENKEYTAAQFFFKKIHSTTKDSRIKANSAYYIANSAVRTKQRGANELMKNFVNDYPSHPKHNTAFVEVGNYYFDTGKYASARKWYNGVNPKYLSAKERQTFYFNKGYALYQSKRYKDAEKALQQVKDSDKYGKQAKYYLGYIAYSSDDYKKADTYFEEVSESKEYNKKLLYYKSDRDFRAGNFEKAIESAKNNLPSAKAKEKSQLNKIIGESYFNLKQYKEAIPYLESYKGERGRLTNTDYYLLGYSHYKNGAYSEAVSQFNKIIGGKDAVAQNAYYHLADAYLKSGQKQQALNAFKSASEMNFEADIKEDATYNYSKLTYELGNPFQSIPSVLKQYLVKYPKSPHSQQIETLLVDSYLTSKNYKEALIVLDANKEERDKEILQKVLFFRGLEVFNEGNQKDAIALFDRAIKINILPDYNLRAQFWKAESYYELNEFVLAISNYKAINETSDISIKELQLKEYQLGYSYFKLKKYDDAVIHFKNFLRLDVEKNYLQDATLRLADSYFVLTKYWPAMETYNKAIAQKHKRADYAHFQKAISYGFVNKNNQKIEDLKSFLINFPKSSYRDDAYYALANVYIAEKNIEEGLLNYKKLRDELPKSAFVSKSLLKEGLIYYNNDEPQKALSKFKYLVAEYPKTAEALQAVKTARLVYIDLGKTNEYATWVSSLNFVEITNEELDNITYEAAEKPYQEGDEEKAIVGFEKYLNQFPNGLHKLNSHFYLAQLYIKNKKQNKALKNYLAVAEIPENEYTETALYRISGIYLEEENYDKAIPFLIRLEESADFIQNSIFAQSNLMKSYYEQKKYDETLKYANTVLSNLNIDNTIKIDAQIFKARAALALNKFIESKTAYTEVAKTATGKLGAESIYNLAKFSNKNKNYKVSNTYVQRLAKDFSSHKKYGAQGLVLMAENFYKMDDPFQATYLLESIIGKFTEFPSVIVEAEQLLAQIEAEEAKTNSSIEE